MPNNINDLLLDYPGARKTLDKIKSFCSIQTGDEMSWREDGIEYSWDLEQTALTKEGELITLIFAFYKKLEGGTPLLKGKFKIHADGNVEGLPNGLKDFFK